MVGVTEQTMNSMSAVIETLFDGLRNNRETVVRMALVVAAVLVVRRAIQLGTQWFFVLFGLAMAHVFSGGHAFGWLRWWL
jgi:hypothetical protein